MVNRDEALPSAWPADYGPTRGGWAPIACNRACLTGFIDAYYKALVANDARYTFALTSTGEMLPALVECVKQSANVRGPVSPGA